MHLMEEKRNIPEIHGAERPATPIYPGSGILRRAIRKNIVSFPSQIPVFHKGSESEMQWRIALLFFVRGWSVAKLAGRFQVPKHRIWTLLNAWSIRAMALGHVQVIDPEAFAACCRSDFEGGSDEDSEEKVLAGVTPVVGSVIQGFPDADQVEVNAEAPTAWHGARVGAMPSGSPDKSLDVIGALDVAVARCEEWGGEFWVRTGMHLRDLRTAALAALEVARSGERRDVFFKTSPGSRGRLRVRGKERVSHAVA